MISMDKQYRTKDGKEVRLYAIDGKGQWPIHGAFLLDNGWKMATWGLSDDDLIEVVMIPEYWVVFNGNGKIAFVVNQEPNQLTGDCFSIHHPAQEKPNV